MDKLRTRLACWWYGHAPEDWDNPDWNGVVIFGRRSGVKRYLCHRCKQYFWQYEGLVGHQIMDSDPRLKK